MEPAVYFFHYVLILPLFNEFTIHKDRLLRNHTLLTFKLCIYSLREKHISNKKNIVTNISKVKNQKKILHAVIMVYNRKFKIIQIWFVCQSYCLFAFYFLWCFCQFLIFTFSLFVCSFLPVLNFYVKLINIYFLCVSVFTFRCIFDRVFLYL